MRVILLGLVTAVTLAVAACGGPLGTSTPSAGPTASQLTNPSPSISSSPSPAATEPRGDSQSVAPASPTLVAQVIDVTLSDAIRIDPRQMTARAGIPVTFRVTNVGVLAHEFFVGDEAAQTEHEAEMVAMGGTVPIDKETGIAVQPGETKDLTLTFTLPLPGELLAGCHVTNHYSGGMKATITITE
jgi:uncharacterized cupredoxin-like copper-binding protein